MKASGQRGFALLIVLSLLGLLILAVYALSALTRVDSQLAGTAIYQTQARQNALLGLNAALGQLHQYARQDDRVTGMAGITGVASGANHPARHWCGIWTGAGGFLAWMASGMTSSIIPTLDSTNAIKLVSTGSLSTDVTNREHVWALLVPLPTTSSAGANVTQGNMAYWVGDEGVKLSLVIPDADAVITGKKHAINQQFTGVLPTDANLAKVLTYEQVGLAGATGVQPQGGFHSYGVTHYGFVSGVLKAGVINVNSAGARLWEGVAATYNLQKSTGAATLDPTTFGNSSNMSAVALWSTAETGKMAAGPFTSIPNGFFVNSRVTAAITRGTTLLSFRQTVEQWLAVRSDTFRIRAYGDAVNPVDSTKVESSAYCEAIVQRVKDSTTPAGEGRFVIVYFRWLGPDDI